ncbi:MAG TPA: MBL fold metallo-hydrolase [Pelomicrobium sp.]|nr:MBL fold metallo-hydrolase [Pelomicrobium sp.]
MTRWLQSLLLVPALLALPAWALDISPVQVAPGVYAVIGELGGRTYENEGLNANVGFIVTDEGVVVVDSGASYQSARKLHEAIRRTTDRPVKWVINTGGQDHRWLGNGYFREQGAEIIAHAKAKADMEARGADQLAALAPVLKEKLDGTRAVLPTRTFTDRLVLAPGGREIQVIHFGAGHTPGDSVVWLPKERVLFTGDLVYVERLLGVIPVSSVKSWLAAFDAMAKLEPRTVVPGHGAVCDLGKARRDTYDYLVLLRTHMKKAVADFVDLQRAIDSLDQSAFARLANYDDLKGGNASRAYLEAEAE